MEQEIVRLTKKLIAIKSAPENKQALGDCLKACLAELTDFTIERFERDSVKSALVYNTPKRPKRFKVLLNGHLDIIPGKDFQYIPKVKDGKLYGVAAMDMKASVASFIVVFKALAKKVDYPLGIQFVTDEEVGGFNGTKYQIDQGIRADFVIVGETTNFCIENQAKGIVWVKVSCKGKAAHGAYPWKGENAIWKMNAFLNSLEKRLPLPKQKQWVTTVNLARIETSNHTFNKIPDQCQAWLDIRYVPEETDSIIRSIKETVPKGFKVDILVQEPAQYVDPNNMHMKLLQKLGKQVAKRTIALNQGQGSSDARHFTRVKCDAIEFGPFGGGMGTDNEWVDIKSLGQYAAILKEFLLQAGKIAQPTKHLAS